MQHEEKPRNSNERQWSRWKMQQPTMGGRGWRLQICRLMGDNTTTSRGRQDQDGKVEVPQEATWQPVGVNEKQTGGGVAGAT